MKKKRKLVEICILIVAVIGVFTLVGVQIVKIQNNAKTSNYGGKVSSSTNTALIKNLSEQTTLNIVRLSSKESDSLSKINKEYLIDNRIIGSFIGVSNDKIKFLWQNGYANKQINNIFRIDTTFLVGNYQGVVDTGMIMNLVSEKSIDLDRPLSKYLPGNQSLGSQTVRNFLKNGSNLSIKISDQNRLLSTNDSRFNNAISTKNSSNKNYVSADNFIREQLIAKVTNTTYKKAIEELLIAKIGLTGTRVYTVHSTQANDAQGYTSKEKGKNLTQDKVISFNEGTSKTNQLRMTLSDIVVSANALLSNQMFNEKYDTLFKDAVNNLAGSEMGSKEYTYSGNIAGQALKIKASDNGNKVFVLTSTVAKSTVNFGKLVTELFDLL